jgi:hypothetical protein
MSCNNYKDILDCTMSVGGISNIYIFPFGSVYDYSYTDDNLSKIDDYKINVLGSAIKCKTASTFTEVLNKNQNDTYTHTLSLVIQKMEWEKRAELFKIIRGALTIIFKDKNNKCWIIGRKTPVKISEFEQTTDTEGGDNVYTMSLLGNDLEPVKEIKCYDTNCAISVNGIEVRQSFFTINDASIFDFTGNYELLGDLITRDINPITPLDPTNWFNPLILANDIATMNAIINPNGNSIVNLYYDSGSDIALIVIHSTDTTYPFMSIGLQPLNGNVSIDVNLQTTYSTSLTGVTISVTDESMLELYNLPAGSAVVGTGLSGIAENSFINVSTLYPMGQTFTVNVLFEGESCVFNEYTYTYEPSNECQLINNYTLHNGKHYSVVVEKLTETPIYREITIVIGEYQFNLYNNYNDYHSVFNTLQTHIINSLNSYPSLDIFNITVTEQPKTWTLTFDSLNDDELDFYVYTRGNDSTFIDEIDTTDIRKYVSNRSTILALQTTCPSDSDLIIKNSNIGAEIYGEVNQYPNAIFDVRLEEVAPYTNAVTNSIGIDINDWQETDTITVQNESLSCPDVLNSFTIDTCLDLVKYTDDYKLYLFSIQTTNIGDSITFDTSDSGLITVLLPSDITPANYPDFGDFMKTSVPTLFNANLQFDAITETFYLEFLTTVGNIINSVTSDNTSTPFVEEYVYQENVYEIETKQHPDIDINWTTDTYHETALNLIGKVKDYSNFDNRVVYKYCDFNYDSVFDLFEVNFLFNSPTQGYTFEFFYAPFPAVPAVADYTMIIAPSTFNDSVSLFSTLITVANIRYIRIRNGQGYEQIIRWNGTTQQNVSIDVNYTILFKQVYGRFDKFKFLYDFGVAQPEPTLIRTSINCPNTDIIVLNFLEATGIIDSTIEEGLNTFVTTLRANNLLVKCKAIYPFVGGTAFTHKFNLLNPLDSDAAFRLTFFGGWTHNSNGVTPNGINAYANTHFTESVNSAGLNDKHISIYSRINLLGQWTDMAAYNGTNAATDISPRFFISGERCLVRNSNVSGSNYLNNNSHGLFINNRIDSGNVRMRQNATLNVIASPSVALVNVPYYIGANNLNGTAGSFSVRNLAFADIGDGFTDAESLIYYNAVQALQTTLSRQV